ncbi:MAG: sugar transferase [Thermoguttaceae bacterium]
MTKRLFDIFASTAAIIVFSPLLIGVALIIKLTSPGPIFFRQKRVGKGKTYFSILKFRTMRMDTPKDVPTHLMANPENFITPIGKFLRKTSLDELPQLFNILRGDMSVIGPRPALWNQDDLVVEREKYRANDVRPGLSGWAQINGRDELPIDVKAKLDGDYVRRQSFWFDMRCILGTFFAVFRQSGVLEGGTGTLTAKTIDEKSSQHRNAA